MYGKALIFLKTLIFYNNCNRFLGFLFNFFLVFFYNKEGKQTQDTIINTINVMFFFLMESKRSTYDILINSIKIKQKRNCTVF